jgi:hypothetical protein
MVSRAVTSKEFKRALSLLGRPTTGQRKFLQAHYRATARITTMRKLAHAAGYKRYGGVNLQYGGLARRIAHILNRPLPRIRVSLLVEFIQPEEVSNRHYLLRMRPAFAAALRSAGWVR